MNGRYEAVVETLLDALIKQCGLDNRREAEVFRDIVRATKRELIRKP